ncbi:DUF6192 family protein [Streptomyces niveus]|uniref:DUF6192 family protein n=1 Tax=Streptomyces niveus TaxID=193462 RepID=UPI003655DB04
MNATLTRLAEDIGLKFNSVKSVRRVASRRPAGRQPGRDPGHPAGEITAIHSRAQDGKVAAAVTSVFLKRPEVAAEMAAEVTPVDKARVVEEFRPSATQSRGSETRTHSDQHAYRHGAFCS